ncbi:Predicted gene 10160 [Apodemus speciosus]|uniref:Predicted gene 10160 n=1 Tax=Apodemus speciosus TaxID=105296 RepID=A0ABQ0F3Q3_APOSI
MRWVSLCSPGYPGTHSVDQDVLPVHTTATPSSSVEEKHPKSSSKVESRKGRSIFKVLRNIRHTPAVVPREAEELEPQASTSREKPQSKIKVLSKHADSASSEEGEEKSPLRRVKVASKKNRKGSNILRTILRKGTLPLTDVDRCNFIDETCTEKTQNKREVNLEEVPPVPERLDSATLSVDKEKAPVKLVGSRNRRSVLAILRKFSRKRSVAPLEVERHQILPGTSRKTAHVTTEGFLLVPESADTAPSAGGQGARPLGKEKHSLCEGTISTEVKSSSLDKCTILTQKLTTTSGSYHFNEACGIYTLRNPLRGKWQLKNVDTRGICQTATVTSQDIERPSVSGASSAKTTEIKTKVMLENTDKTLAPDVNKNTSETLESEEARKCRRMSELLKRIEQKQAMGPQYGIGMQAFSVTSPETIVKKETENASATSVVEEKTSVSMTKVEPRRFKCFFSLLERFYKKDPGPSQDPEEPPVLESTSKEIPKIRKRASNEMTNQLDHGTENVPDIKQIFCKEEEFEPHDEGSWEEYKSCGMASTMVGSYTAQAGDTDIEQQQQDLDSKESYPDVIEVQQWELRKVSSTMAPVADTLFLAPPPSSDDDNHISITRTKRKKWRRRY